MQSNDHFGAVTCTIDMDFQPEDLEKAVGLLVSGTGCTEATPGCRSCTVTHDVGEKNQVRYSEEWDGKAAFVRHLRSEEFRRILVAMDMCSSEPLVRIGNISGRIGLQYLRELRETVDESNDETK